MRKIDFPISNSDGVSAGEAGLLVSLAGLPCGSPWRAAGLPGVSVSSAGPSTSGGLTRTPAAGLSCFHRLSISSELFDFFPVVHVRMSWLITVYRKENNSVVLSIANDSYENLSNSCFPTRFVALFVHADDDGPITNLFRNYFSINNFQHGVHSYYSDDRKRKN